jgi:ATP-dependent Clp protease ATP-binding subunit ClpC
VFIRFTEKAKQSMRLAIEAAKESRCEHLDPEHILVGILEAAPNRAVEILEERRIESDVLLETLRSHPESEEPLRLGQLPFTPRSKLVLEAALDAAKEARHSWIGTEHLLAGLALTADAGLAGVLHERGLTAQSICATLTTSSVLPAAEGTPPEPQRRILKEIAALIAKLSPFRRRGD